MIDKIMKTLYEEHDIVKEKLLILKDVVYSFPGGIFKIPEKIYDFFRYHIDEHFKKEEILIKYMKDNVKLGNDEIKLLNDFIEEHDIFKKEKNSVFGLVFNLKRNSKPDKREVLKRVRGLTEDIVDHADREDNGFYPMVVEKLSSNQISEVAQIIRDKESKGKINV